MSEGWFLYYRDRTPASLKPRKWSNTAWGSYDGKEVELKIRLKPIGSVEIIDAKSREEIAMLGQFQHVPASLQIKNGSLYKIDFKDGGYVVIDENGRTICRTEYLEHGQRATFKFEDESGNGSSVWLLALVGMYVAIMNQTQLHL